MDEVITEFLTESQENLSRLDQELVELEKAPRSVDLLASVFRTFHTMKGVAGFLNFTRLEGVAHVAEDLLSRLRDGALLLDADITSALLAAVDAVRQMLATVEASGNDGTIDYSSLVATFEGLSAKAEVSTDAAPTADQSVTPLDESAQITRLAVTEPDPPPMEAPPEIKLEVVTAAPITSDLAKSERTESNAAPPIADSTIRVNVHLLDKLMNLVGELVLVRNQVLQYANGLQESTFLGASQRLNLITTELQEGIMKTRMQPIGTIWSKFPRIVRDLALACGKQVRIEMEGEETELDKTLIEAIRDPLTHVVRNAIDHGIETPQERTAAGKPPEGRLLLRAFHESGQVLIEIAEDGAGVDVERVRARALERGLVTAEQATRLSDAEAIKLLFQPGFSTAAKITNISGRGVGMDVVKTNIEKIGGTVELHSRHGEGTRLRVKIPLTLAIIPALVVTCAGDRYAIPQVNLIELVRLESDERARRVELIHGAPVYRLRGNLLPLVYLREVLQIAESEPLAADAPDRAAHIVVLQVGDQQIGLVVDEVNDTEEIVVKPLGKRLKGMSAFAGATIMGDGRVALILDALGLVQLAGVGAESRENSYADDRRAPSFSDHLRQRLLLCRAGSAARVAVPLALVSRLEEFPRANLERAAGCDVVSYRGQILPLVDLGDLAGGGRTATDSELVKVVVFDDGQHRVGMMVEEIIDIVEEEAVAAQLSSRADLIGSALVGKKTTDFLDLRAVFEAARQRWYDAQSAAEIQRAAILLIDQSPFTSGLVRSYLEMAGHQVHEARSAAEALSKLERHHVQLALVSANLPGNGAMLEQIRAKTREAGIALIGLADERDEIGPAIAAKYDACHFKSDRQAILDAIARLIVSDARRPDGSLSSPQARA